jgi:hypothetical protein
MNKLGAPAGCAFGKIIFFQEQYLEPPLGSINSNAQPCCTTTNNDDIPNGHFIKGFNGIISVQLYKL